MSSVPSTEWGMADAWLLAAIASARADPGSAGATLASGLMTAEGINHAVPTRGETELAIRNLLGSGLIEVDARAKHFRLTEAGQKVRSRWRHGMFGWIEALPPALRRLGPPQPAEWSLPRGAYEHAIEEAKRTLHEVVARHRRKRRR